MVGKALQDQNPDMKNIAASFAGKLCLALKHNAGTYMKTVIDSLIGNLVH